MDIKIFNDGLTELGVDISKEQTNKFVKYSSMLKEWNEKINLTAVTDDEGISVKHFLDSILPVKALDISDANSIIDVGTGAGFPGLPIKICNPGIRLTLLDSLNKRINFLNAVKDELALENVECIHGRAEEYGKMPEYRESYDIAISRAVANLTVLSEYCLPFVKQGGAFLALKADGADEEIKSAEKIIRVLGGKIEDICKIKLPQSEMTRYIVIIRKVEKTPEKYPRRADKIKKSAK